MADKNRMGLTAYDPTTSESSRESLKWFAAILLAVMLIGVTAIAYWLPIKRYTVTCIKSPTISCELQRETANEHQNWQGELGNHPVAMVKIQPARRGAARIFLYLNSDSERLFAAEFEGGGAAARAQSAASELNHFFTSAYIPSVRIVASPPKYLTWMLWGAVGFLCMFVLVIYRELFNWKRSSRKSV